MLIVDEDEIEISQATPKYCVPDSIQTRALKTESKEESDQYQYFHTFQRQNDCC